MATEPGSTRARGREVALLALCHLESYGADERESALALLWDHPPGEADDAVRELWADESAQAFARELLEKLLGSWARLDETIEATSSRWRLERMETIERNVLRIATCELSETPDTPRAVVIAEAVRLAERYGGERSAPFVNGVVEALAKRVRDESDGKGGA